MDKKNSKELIEFTIESGKAERHYSMDLWRLCVFGTIYFRKTEKTFADVS